MLPPIEGPRRSNLIFVPCRSLDEPIRLDRLRRVREPVSRSKSGVQGKVADVLRGRSRHAESQNELKAFQVLMATARSDAWQEQPFFLEYHHEGAKHRYTPDILVVWGAHQEVVEIKEDGEADSPENQARFALIRELLAEHGFHFRVWKKSEICAEPRLANAALILRYRCVRCQPRSSERIRRTFSSTPELPLRAFCETSRNGGSERASARARWHAAHRLVGAAQPRFQNQHHANWPPGWPLSAMQAVRRPDVAARIENRAACQDRAGEVPDSATARRKQWQLQNTATGEWCTFDEDDLLDQFARNELSFDRESLRIGIPPVTTGLAESSLATFPPIRPNWSIWPKPRPVSEGDRPAAADRDHAKTMEPLIQSVAERIKDNKPPGWRTVCRDYGKWLAAGRDIRAIISEARRSGQPRYPNGPRGEDHQRSGHPGVVHDG